MRECFAAETFEGLREGRRYKIQGARYRYWQGAGGRGQGTEGRKKIQDTRRKIQVLAGSRGLRE